MIGLLVGVAIDAQQPVDVGRDLGRDILQRRGEGGELLLAFVADIGGGGGEQDFGLEDEAVAHDLHIAAVAQHFPQLAEELRAVAGKLGDLVDQRFVQALAQIGDLHLICLGLGFRDVEGGGELRQLFAHGRHLAVQ